NPRVLVDGHDLASTMKEIVELRVSARKLEEKVAALMVETARNLAKADVPLRDIGTALEVSHQRVHQLLQGDVPSGAIPRSAVTRATVKKASARKAAAATRSP